MGGEGLGGVGFTQLWPTNLGKPFVYLPMIVWVFFTDVITGFCIRLSHVANLIHFQMLGAKNDPKKNPKKTAFFWESFGMVFKA